MKKISIGMFITFTISLSLIFSFFIPISIAFPPEGYCKDYHKVVNIIPYYEKTASINLDGIPNENFWTKHSNQDQNGTLTIPLASETSMPEFVVVNLNITFVKTDSHLYILCEWFDNTTKPDLSVNLYDGIYFCWDIDVINFSAFYTSGMSTLHMGGGDIDNWGWSCLAATSPVNGSSYFCKDRCFGTYGWYSSNLETEDVEVAYNYRINRSYTLEIKRNLGTNDPFDVQFDQSKIYEFNMGIMNDGNHEEHLISWTYALDLRSIYQPERIYGYNLLIISIFALFSILIIIIRKKKTKLT